MTPHVIYIITCAVNGKKYVGYSRKTAEQRFQAHLNSARWKKPGAIYDAIRCYGSAAFSVEKHCDCADHKEACKRERELISAMGTMLPNGYNMTAGGDGVPLTPERWCEIGMKKRGKRTPAILAYWERLKGRKLSPEHREKLSDWQKRRVRKPEQYLKMVETFKRNGKMKGRPWTAARRAAHKPKSHASNQMELL